MRNNWSCQITNLQKKTNYVTNVRRNMNEMSREYELWEYLNATFTLLGKHMYSRLWYKLLTGVEKDKTVSFEEQYWHYKRDVAWYSITVFEGV